jgi:pimeloyl-ACP methyl ester carboxylesterase
MLSCAPPAAPTFHDVRLESGLRLRYAQQGAPDGPVMLMLHGYTDSSFSFSRVLQLLPPALRVIVPDQRGHGGSDRPARYDINSFAVDAVQLMDALAIERATIVGHSMGSFVARTVASIAPSRVSGLVLVGAAPDARNPGITELRRAVEDLCDPVDHGFVRDFQVGTVQRELPPGFIAHAITESERVPAAVWKAALAGLMAHQGSDEEIGVPTLVLGGDRDGVFSRAEQEALGRRIPGARVQIFAGIGHALHWEDPERFVGALLSFVNGISGGVMVQC